jgi:hypothetical protein
MQGSQNNFLHGSKALQNTTSDILNTAGKGKKSEPSTSQPKLEPRLSDIPSNKNTDGPYGSAGTL